MKNAVARLLISLFVVATAIGFSSPSWAWTVYMDFEGGAPGQSARGDTAFSEAFATTYSNERAFAGNQSGRMTVTGGTTAYGEWGGIRKLPAYPKEGEEMWLRAAVYFPTTFDYSANPWLKFLRIHTRSAAGSNEGYLDLYILNNGLFSYNNEVTGTVNNPLGVTLQKGKWETYEVYVKFSSVAGQGIYRVWQNGKLIHDNKSLKTLRSSSSSSDAVYIFTYWNGGAPKSQQAFVDDVVITTTRPSARDTAGNYMIGPAPYGAKRPAAPASLLIQ